MSNYSIGREGFDQKNTVAIEFSEISDIWDREKVSKDIVENFIVELEEDMTDIPYGFTEEWDFYPNAIYLNLDHSDWDKVGLQTTYNGGGESHSSNLVWFEITQNANPTGINEVNADNKDAKVFNLQGVQLKKMQRGINIVNGQKVVRK